MTTKNIRISRNKTIPLACVIFDWDGTLLDSFEADAQAYSGMFQELGMAWSLEQLKLHYSPNWHRVYRAARLPRARWMEADALWMKFYRRHTPVLQIGARQALRAIERRFTMALVSSGNKSRVLRQLREQKLSAMFRTKVCCEDAPHRKPHPAPLRTALDRLRVPPEACIYVGDAPEDIEMAHRAGVRAIGVLGGSPVPHRLRAAGADSLIETIRELPAILKNF